MSEFRGYQQPLTELTRRIEGFRQDLQEKFGQIPQDIEFAEGEEALAQFYVVLLSFSLRPALFVYGGSFHNLADHLHGLEYGLKFGREPIPCLEVVTNRGFDVWLSDNYRTPLNMAWSGALLKIYPDESEAIVQIPILFARYLHELRTGLWSRENGPVKKRRPRKGNKSNDA